MSESKKVEPIYPIFMPVVDQDGARKALARAQFPFAIFDGMLIVDFRDLFRLDPRMN